jgi:hypothetical protein
LLVIAQVMRRQLVGELRQLFDGFGFGEVLGGFQSDS